MHAARKGQSMDLKRILVSVCLAGALLPACIPTRDLPVLTCSADSDCPAGANLTCNLKTLRCEKCDACSTAKDTSTTDVLVVPDDVSLTGG